MIVSRKPGAIVLAAGHSERMGQCKFLLKTSNGKSFIEHIWNQFMKFGSEQVFVVTQTTYLKTLEELGSKSEQKPVLVENKHPEKERFYSLQLGIKAMGNNDYVFVHNADNPFLDLNVLEALNQNRNMADYIVPTYQNQGGHPVLLGKKVIRELIHMPESLRLDQALKSFKRFNLACQDPMLAVNINTPDNYKHYFN